MSRNAKYNKPNPNPIPSKYFHISCKNTVFFIFEAVKPLHFIALDNPFQPHYGGSIDMYFRLQAMIHKGIVKDIHFFHKPIQSMSPSQFNIPVYAYVRNLSLSQWFSRVPFTVLSRKSSDLMQNLSKDDLPIWMEGIHTAYLLPNLKKNNPKRKIFLRLHNIEFKYYHELYTQTKNPLKKIYFYAEHLKLKGYEPQLWRLADAVFCISDIETSFVKSIQPKTHFLPAFMEDTFLPLKFPQTIRKLLFHGNFMISANQYSAQWLLNFCQKYPSYKPVFYGRGWEIIQKKAPFAQFLSNSSPLSTYQDSYDAIILPIFQSSGVKIKWLESIRLGKLVLGTPQAAEGSGIHPLHTFYYFDQLLLLLQNSTALMTYHQNLYEQTLNLYQNNTNISKLLEWLKEYESF